MSFHLISSDGISINVVVTSLVTSDAYCCIDLKIISFAISFFESSILFLYFIITSFHSSSYLDFISSIYNIFASFSVNLAISDNFQSSSIFFSSIKIFFSFRFSSF
jgi:hypothetical protein